MIYTVTLNPSIDYIAEVDELRVGGLNRMKRDLKLPGGKGINVSRVLSRLGVANTATGFLGGFTGGFIGERLTAEGITGDFVKVSGDTRINIKLKAGTETEINGAGPDITPAEAEALLHKLDALRSGDIVVLSGSIPPSLGGNYYERLIAVCKRQGAEFVIDTTGEPLKRAMALSPLLVKPNHHELAELFGVENLSRDEIIVYGRKLLEWGAQHVLVSMAGEGALLLSGGEVYSANAPKGRVKNSVGAGDSMIAGFVGTLSQGGSVQEAFRTGVASGSATAFSDDLAEGGYIRQLEPGIQVTQL
ncbi:1-phosphofructokinase [Paenibacillus tepidiphilus]|uniref:1-phosphofructokinase n=1 Tax=Paenibacillus tepidiphilus TaxID=2608683 RepID=UPI001239EDBD|nr:1-phosphofructokinase [Paenibacillus tepidiphilus]